MDIDPLLAAIKDALTKVDNLAGVVRTASPEQIEEALHGLQAAMDEAEKHGLELKDHLAALERELIQLDQLVLEQGMYWRKIGQRAIGGPFCPKCYEARGELLKLHYHPGAIGTQAHRPYYQCDACDAVFEV